MWDGKKKVLRLYLIPNELSLDYKCIILNGVYPFLGPGHEETKSLFSSAFQLLLRALSRIIAAKIFIILHCRPSALPTREAVQHGVPSESRLDSRWEHPRAARVSCDWKGRGERREPRRPTPIPQTPFCRKDKHNEWPCVLFNFSLLR